MSVRKPSTPPADTQAGGRPGIDAVEERRGMKMIPATQVAGTEKKHLQYNTTVDTRQAAWQVTREISLRGSVRAYTRRLKNGQWANNATSDQRISAGMPAGPWALYLAWEGSYQYVCFDLDAHGGSGQERRQVIDDCQAISRLLDQASIPYLVCQSGPAGGRHIWASSLDSLTPRFVKTLALGLRRLAPSLDITPLVNPATGCARPPYSPHRLGGYSTPLTGGLDALTTPSVGIRHWETLSDLVEREAAPTLTDDDDKRGLAADPAGHDYLAGIRRTPSHRTLTLLNTPITPRTDASRRLWSITLGLINSHWTLTDYLTLAQAGKPGFTHAYASRQTDGHRIPRDRKDTLSILTRTWRRALAWATTHFHTPRPHTDPQLADRILSLWTSHSSQTHPSRGHASERRTLACLCLWALQAGTDTIQADIRRIALTSGIDKETARRALQRLQDQQIIHKTAEPHGRQAATWTLRKTGPTQSTGGKQANPATSGNAPHQNPHPTLLHQEEHETTPTPHQTSECAAYLTRLLLHTLTDWLTRAGHDAATSQGLGLTEGNQQADQNTPLDALDLTAAALAATGTQDRRRQRYEAERRHWHAFLDILTWMKAPRQHKPHQLIRPYQHSGRIPLTHAGIPPTIQTPAGRSANRPHDPAQPRPTQPGGQETVNRRPTTLLRHSHMEKTNLWST